MNELITIRVKFIFDTEDYTYREYSFNSREDTQIARSFELLKLVHSAGNDAITLDAKISSIIVIE